MTDEQQAALAAKDARIAELERKGDGWKRAYERALEQANDHLDTIAAREAELATQERTNNEMVQRMAAYEAELAEVKSALGGWVDEAGRYKRERDTAEAELATVRGQVGSLLARVRPGSEAAAWVVEELQALATPPRRTAEPWRPIETADKYGPPIRAYAIELIDADFNPSGSVEACWADDIGWIGAVWDGQHDVWGTRPITPTYWMPLPTPPRRTPEGER
jgi:hypothetical protein